MNPESILIIVLAGILGFSVFSRWIEDSLLTLPILFTTMGYVIFLLSDSMLEQEHVREGAKFVAEVTLILVLFADASHVRFSKLADSYKIPLRMLIFGMPLTILLGTLVTHWVSPELSWFMALLVAAILTPTDAALGQTVVSSPEVPAHLSQAINVESGLNDGLALPVILLAAGLSVVNPEGVNDSSLLELTLIPIILGPLAGIFIGWSAARLLNLSEVHKTISISFEGIFFLATAFLSYIFAEFIGGNGFIAAFAGGMVFGNFYKGKVEFIGEFMEGQGQIMTMAAFFIFGFALLPMGLEHANYRTITLAILFLSVVRMLPIFISLSGSGLRIRDKLFLGWFGPRGLASILFALLIVQDYDIPDKEETLACVVLTVLFSIILHGMTSAPLAHHIGRK